MRRLASRPQSALGLALAILTTCAVGPARADISFVNMFRNVTYQQTGDGNALAATGAFFSVGLASTSDNEFDSVQLTYPGAGSPVALGMTDARNFVYQTSSLASQAAMDTQYPVGVYSFAAMNASGTSTATLTYAADAYSTTLPFLAGNDFSNLQNAPGSTPITFHFSPFTPPAGVTNAFLFFTLFDQTLGKSVFDAGFQPPTTTEVTVPASVLIGGHSYTYEIDFSDRVNVDGTGADFSPQIGFDVRTDGNFSLRPVPEPGTLALVGLGGAFVLGWTRRKSRA